MRLVITSHKFLPDVGGIELISYALAQAFVSKGYSVRIISQSQAHPDQDDSLFPFLLLRRPSPLQIIDCYLWSDVILQINLEARLLWPFLLIRRPLVIGLMTWNRDVSGLRSRLHLFKGLLLRVADSVIACSHSIRSDTFKTAIVIPPPYRSDIFRFLPSILRRNAIVYLGRLVSDKGVDLLLHAFALMQRPGWELTIIGTGPEKESLLTLTQDLGLSRRVSFLGSLQGEELVQILNQHQIMVIPSRWREPFGVVALEGMACGCVPLASDGGGLPDAIGASGLLFRRGDVNDLIAKLRLIIDSPGLRESLRRTAPDHLKRFTIESVLEEYSWVIKNAVKPPLA